MYNRIYPNRSGLREEFIEGVSELMAKTKTLHEFLSEGVIRCPCRKCKCGKLLQPDVVKVHLYKKGFMENYYVWTIHGEDVASVGNVDFQKKIDSEGSPLAENNAENSRFSEMVRDAFVMHSGAQSEPNDDARRFYEQLEEASRPLYKGSMHSKLSVAVRLLSIKSDSSIFQAGIDSIIGLMNELNPNKIDLHKDFNTAKKLVSKLGLSSERIDCCEKDGEAWKHFDRLFPNFASEPRNIRLGLCADGFIPFSVSAAPYSCWPVFVTPYNLPPELCVETYDISTKQNFRLHAALMRTINDFPAYGILYGWSTAGKLACPTCMEETKAFTLKHGGKNTWFDCHRRFLPMDHEFRRNTSAFMKNQTDFEEPLSPLSPEEIWNRVRFLPKVTESPMSNKIPGYGVTHNWTKQRIFWELPYWRHNLLQHNLDVMHIEKNFFDNLFNTIMDVNNKTKDNLKARMDLKEYCR
ncbi:uncharacterized protein [Nicotiana sylvestris]|uniref:uncharacterized protein n=1 Tax=Nicotiana sylvestris TaxID=4096 RepID=UPI00388CAB4A